MKQDKKKLYFKAFIDEFIRLGNPVSSNLLKQVIKQKYNIDVSSATLRNVLAEFRKLDFLSKNSNTSGNMPTKLGFDFYVQNILEKKSINQKKFTKIWDLISALETGPKNELSKKLKYILENRKLSIEDTIYQTTEIISKTLDVAIVTKTDNLQIRLKSINMTVVDNNQAVMVITNSIPEVDYKIFNLKNSQININDLKTVVRIFNDRLVDVPLVKLKDHIFSLVPIIKRQVENYELIFQEFLSTIFNYKVNHYSKTHNQSGIIISPKISRSDLYEIVEISQKKSIWEMLENSKNIDEKIRIDIMENKDITLISKKLKNNKYLKEISILGPKRMDYQKSLLLLESFDNLIEEIKNEKNKLEEKQNA